MSKVGLSRGRPRKAASASSGEGLSRGRLAFGASGEGLSKAGLGKRGGRGRLVASTFVSSIPKHNNLIEN